MAIEIVDLPIKNGDFHSYVGLPEGKSEKASYSLVSCRFSTKEIRPIHC